MPGLVRFGVAPDHPEVKSVQHDFEAVAADPRVRFLGNVRLGKDLTLPELASRYNAVVLAYGAASDRSLGVPGEELSGVFSARAFVNWYNGHPDFTSFAPNLDAEDVVIVGQGNVAIDCARILSKTPAELRSTDIATHALEALSRSRVKRVTVIGRRGHVQAAFTMKELRESAWGASGEGAAVAAAAVAAAAGCYCWRRGWGVTLPGGGARACVEVREGGGTSCRHTCKVQSSVIIAMVSPLAPCPSCHPLAHLPRSHQAGGRRLRRARRGAGPRPHAGVRGRD